MGEEKTFLDVLISLVPVVMAVAFVVPLILLFARGDDE